MSWQAGYPPLPATVPGGGGAGYRVFTANGSLNRIRLTPESGVYPL
jgi:hypothetical protein